MMYNKKNRMLRKCLVPRKIIIDDSEPFGKKLAKLRNLCGYSQRDLAKEVGISQRMIAYYEKETNHPPTHLLPVFAKALNVTADELLGLKEIDTDKVKDHKLWKKFERVQKLDSDEKKQILKLLDAFIEKDEFKKKAMKCS